MYKRLLASLMFIAALALASTSARADALHGFCTTTTCSDNGSITPVDTGTFTFGFWAASGPESGDDILVFISPTALTTGELTVSETNTGTTTGTATLLGTWTGGGLDSLLGLSAQPTNPFGNYGGSGGLDAGVTSFDVYTLDLGSQTLQPQGTDGSGPLFSVSGEPTDGLFILDFLSNCTPDPPACAVATANSGALEVTAPEPSSLILLGLGLLGLVGFRGRRRFASFAS